MALSLDGNAVAHRSVLTKGFAIKYERSLTLNSACGTPTLYQTTEDFLYSMYGGQ